MHITSYSSLIYCFLLGFCTRDSLSIPANAFSYVGNTTTRHLSLYAVDSSPNLNLPPNVTSPLPLQEDGLKYRVPNTYVVPTRPFFWRNKVKSETISGSQAAYLLLDLYRLSSSYYLEKTNTNLEVTISQVTMLFYLGFAVDRIAIYDTIDAARK